MTDAANPFDQFDTAPTQPPSTENPFDQFDAPAVSHVAHTFATRGPDGKEVRFQAPADADDKTIRAAAAKATGSKAYLASTVKRDGSPIDPEQTPTHGGLWTGLEHAADAFSAGVMHPAGAALDTLIPHVGQVDGPDVKSMWETGKGFAEQYAHNLGQIRNQYDADGYAHPIAAGTGTVAGAVLSPVNKIAAPVRGASLLANAARAGEGAMAYGALHGAASSRSDNVGGVAADAGREALYSGAAGSVLGAGLQGLVRAGNAALPAVARLARGRPSASAATDLVASRLAADNITPADAATTLTNARANGVPAVLADLGENMRALGGSVSRQPGAARTTAMAATGERQFGQGERIRDAINRDLGPTTDTFAEANRLQDQARTNAAPLYDAFHANAPRTSQTIEGLLQTPAGRAALGRARTIAANDQVAASELGTEVDAAGNPILNPQPISAAAERDAARSALDEAQQGYQAARATPGSPAMATARNRVLAARERLRDASTALANSPDPSQPAQINAFTPRTLDYVKQGIDDVLNDYRDGTTGRLNLGPYGGSIEGVRQRFVSEMDRLFPDYAPARAAYAGPASLKTALADGRAGLNKSADEINQRLTNMSEAEQGHYALGLRSAMTDMLSRSPDGANQVRKLIGSDAKRQALARVFGGTGNLDRFMSTLSDEQSAFRTYNTVHGGSPTASRVGEDGANGDLQALQHLAQLAGAAKKGWPALIAHGASNLGDAMKYGAGAAGQRTREDAASLLFSTNPGEFGDAFERANIQRLIALGRKNGAVAGGANIGGRLGSLIEAGQR
jgi:hypothetical protein